MATKRKSFGLVAEQIGPVACSITTLLALIVYRDDVVQRFAPGGWKADGLYSAIFNWAAIQTGFAFGVYGFVLGKTDGFIDAARDTLAMSRFVSYVKIANIAGFLLTILSIPLLIVNPKLSAPSDWGYLFVASWFSLFIWAFVSFLRIAYNFGRLSSVSDAKPFFGAGA